MNLPEDAQKLVDCDAVDPNTSQTYPYSYNFGGHDFIILSDSWAYDPNYGLVPRNYEFGYWDGHYVYKVNNSYGVDINTHETIWAHTTDHWGVAVAAGHAAFGSECTGAAGTAWAGMAAFTKIAGKKSAAAAVVLTAACGVAGAYNYVSSGDSFSPPPGMSDVRGN